MSDLTAYLNQFLPHITAPDFLVGEGIGNKIARCIFGYAAADERPVHDHLQTLLMRLAFHYQDMRVQHLDLPTIQGEYVKKWKLFKKAAAMSGKQGDVGVLRALKGPLVPEKIMKFTRAEHPPAANDLVLASRVGSDWSMLGAHALLRCIHAMLGGTPLLMLYPGGYDCTGLRLFGRIVVFPVLPRKAATYRAFPPFTGRVCA